MEVPDLDRVWIMDMEEGLRDPGNYVYRAPFLITPSKGSAQDLGLEFS